MLFQSEAPPWWGFVHFAPTMNKPTDARMAQRAVGLVSRPIQVPFNPWKALLIAGLSFSWLSPNHYMPWPAFEADLAMAVVLLIVGAALWWYRAGAWRLDRAVLTTAVVAVIPVAQYQLGLLHFAGDAWMSALYVLGLTAALLFGRRMQSLDREAVIDVVLGGALVASVLSVGVQLYQWLHLSTLDEMTGLGLFVMNLSGARPSGNLAQPNQLATLLIWGLLGVWLAHARKQLSALAALGTAAYLLFGIAMTQSRTAWLALTVIVFAAWLFKDELQGRRPFIACVALGVYFACLVMGWEAINRAALLSDAVPLAERLRPGARLANWQTAIDAVSLRPWWGFGWGQITVAQQAAVLMHEASGEFFADAHNIVLDLLLWNGIPIGLAITIGVAAWLRSVGRSIRDCQGVLMLLAIVAVLVHSLLEYPHAYAYFLLPTGLVAGALNADGLRTSVAAPRWLVGVSILIVALGVSAVVRDYAAAKGNMETLRFEAARVGSGPRSSAPDLPVLTHLGAYLHAARIDVRRRPTSERDLEILRTTSERFPSESTRFRYATAAAISGHPGIAADVLNRLCWMRAAVQCAQIRAAWIDLSQSHPEMRGLLPPE